MGFRVSQFFKDEPITPAAPQVRRSPSTTSSLALTQGLGEGGHRLGPATPPAFPAIL